MTRICSAEQDMGTNALSRARRAIAAAALAGLAGLAASTPALAAPGGVFSQTVYTSGANQMSDTNVGLNNATKVYQNAVNINGVPGTNADITINGVLFKNGGTAAPVIPDTSWSLTGGTYQSFINNPNNGVDASQQIRKLTSDFSYGVTPATLTLNGLTVGQTYTFTNYATGYGAVRNQQITATSGTDVGTIADYNEDAGGNANGSILRYTFVAGANNLALKFTALTAGSFHFYGFSNEQVFTNTYNQTGGGSLNIGLNFSNAAKPALNNVAPSGAGSNAAFPAQATPTTVTLDAATTLGHIQFDGAQPYTLAGTSVLTMQTDNPGGVSVMNALAGTHTIGAPVVLASDVAKLGAGTLAFGSTVSGVGRTLTVGNGALQAAAGNTFQDLAVVVNVDNALRFPGLELNVTLGALGGSGNVDMYNVDGLPYSLRVGNNSATFTGTLSGETGITKFGTGTQTLGNANNIYSGSTAITGGILAVTSLADVGAGGLPSSLGLSGAAPANILIDGGALGYSGAAAATTDRQFTLGPAGGGLDSSGAGAVTFSSTAPLTFGAAASARTFTLSGTNAGLNTVAAVIRDMGGAAINITTLNKTGAGRWRVTGTNTYTGETLFNGGILNVADLTNYGVPGSLGARLQSQENAASLTGIGLHFNGGTLQYTGSTPQSTNREIRVSLAGATIDASGSVPSATVSFTRTGTPTNLFDTPGNRTITLTGTNTGNNSFAIQLINQGASPTGLTKSGTGTWVIPNTDNTYGGTTVFEGGILNVASIANSGSPSSLGNRGADTGPGNVGLLFRGGTLQYTGATPQSTNRQIRISTTGGAFIDASGSNPAATLSFTYTGANADFFEVGGARQLTLTGTNTGPNTFALNVTETGGLTTVNKTGPGTWVMTGTGSTATGNTNVSGGTLLLNGATKSPTIVTGGATLGGSGSIAAPVTVTAGTIAPGNSAGILSTGNLSLTAGSNAAIELNGTTAGAAVGGYDQINVTGTVAVGGNLNVALGYVPAVGNTFTIINNDLADAVTGTFAGLPTSGSTFNVGLATFAINYAGGDGNDVTLNVTVVPEPATLGLAAIGALGLLSRRRRTAR